MTVIVWLIPIALLLGLAGLGAFLWSLRSGQYDDLEGAASRILFDDEEPEAEAPDGGDRPAGGTAPEAGRPARRDGEPEARP